MAIADDCLRCGEYHPDLGVSGLCPACEDEVEILDEEHAYTARRTRYCYCCQAPITDMDAVFSPGGKEICPYCDWCECWPERGRIQCREPEPMPPGWVQLPLPTERAPGG